jgi:hypothetical protein
MTVYPATDDERAIHRLILTYPYRMDEGDFDGAAAPFARCHTHSPAGSYRSADELRQAFEDWVVLYDDGTPRTKHVMTNIDIFVAPDGRSAESWTYFTVLQATDDFPLQIVIAGRYHDRFAKDGDGWYFTEREELLDLIGDLSRHTKLSIDAPVHDRSHLGGQ